VADAVIEAQIRIEGSRTLHLSYDAVAFSFGPCEKRLRYGKLATSSFDPTFLLLMGDHEERSIALLVNR